MRNKRSWLFIISIVIILVSTTLAGCQTSTPTEEPVEVVVEEEAAPAEEEAAPAEEEAAPAEEEAEPAEEVDLPNIRVAIVIQGGSNDGSFAQDSYMGALEIAEMPNVELEIFENVQVPDAAWVIRSYAEDGFDIVMIWSAGIHWMVYDIAPDYPDTIFVRMGGELDYRSDNICIMDFVGEDIYVLAGAIAGAMTKTNKIAYQNAEGYPNFLAGVMNLEIGAQLLNPEAEIITSWTGDFYDPSKAKDSAVGLIEQGVDIIMTGLDEGKFGTIQAAQEADVTVRLMGDFLDQKKIMGVDLFLTSVIVDFPRLFPMLIGALQRGETCEWVFENMKVSSANGTTYLSPTYGDVPEDVLARVEEIRLGMLSGEIDYITTVEYIEEYME